MMQGTITDEQGAGLPGVMVTATSPELQGERSTHTGAEGRYKLRALPPGEYKVAYELEGFATEIESNEVSAGETLESNVEMQLAEVVEDIVVTSNVDTISESTAAVSIHRDEMKKLSVERQLADSAEAPRAQSLTLTGAARAYPRSDVPKPQLAPSTGGTTEPNDAPYGDVFFESAGTNPFIDTEDDALSTFGLDVDSGSYTVARRYLLDGHLPQPESVRVEEFVNYFDYGDAAPEEAEFAIHAEGAPSIFGEGDRYYLLRFNLSGRELDEADRKPALLTFVVDVSGSMARENRLGLVQQALSLLLDQLRPDDRIALVTYGTTGQVVFEPTADREAIRRAIQGLRTGGSTNAEHGLSLAYELAARHARRGMLNRVILCSDGVANVGGTSADTILDRIRRDADQGVELTTVGFGMGNYNDILMERLADEGNGRYAYVDTLDEARRIFVENLTGTLQTLAADARVQVEFDPRVVTRYRLLGYENRDLADERFRDDTADAGEIGVGHSVTALYEIKLRRPPRPRDEIGTLRLRYG
ncbi:MAG: von Willebrand factor type A domain-containing protein, partial [Acidobacteriota bacterium]